MLQIADASVDLGPWHIKGVRHGGKVAQFDHREKKPQIIYTHNLDPG